MLKSYYMLPNTSLRDFAVRLHISRYTLKDRSNIEHAILENKSDSRKIKSYRKEVVEIALKEWFLKVRKKDVR